MDATRIAQMVIETAKQQGAFQMIPPTNDWWDWYAANSNARERVSS
jgi:hypothetical protein